ncbi:MAG: helix-turn-helix transcriptional regulator [Actinobacteria bacterium]|nr:helix-turn-helix transcriptional regulator [Actinomycetota bacterium]
MAAQMLWRIIIGAAIFSVVFGMVWQLVALSAPSFVTVHEYSLGGNLIGALVLFAILTIFKKKIDMGAIYRIALPFLVLGVVLLPFLWSANTSWSNALVGMGNLLFDMAISYLVAEVSFDYRVNGAVVCGVTRGITIGCMAFGMLLGYFLVTYVAIDFLMLLVISLCVLYLIGIGVLMLFNRKKLLDLAKVLENSEAEQSFTEPELAPDLLEQHINAVVQQYHLSRREAEVFGYVARGRSAIYVSETLVVSENTVRSHLRRIYEKLGVHSKQELLDLVERG